MVAGLACGAVTSMVVLSRKEKQPDFTLLVAGALAGAGGGRLPDVLEPATHPNHRAFFHSVLFGAILYLVGKSLWDQITRESSTEERISGKQIALLLLFAVIVAVLVHLLLDSFTKKGLPSLRMDVNNGIYRWQPTHLTLVRLCQNA